MSPIPESEGDWAPKTFILDLIVNQYNDARAYVGTSQHAVVVTRNHDESVTDMAKRLVQQQQAAGLDVASATIFELGQPVVDVVVNVDVRRVGSER